MKPLHTRVRRKGNRRASRGFPRPRAVVYWPICGSPSFAAPQVVEVNSEAVYVWVCENCGAARSSTHWEPISKVRTRRHHQAVLRTALDFDV